jgi:hypothetical protein
VIHHCDLTLTDRHTPSAVSVAGSRSETDGSGRR